MTKKTVGAIVFKLGDNSEIIERLEDAGFEITKLSENDFYVYKDENDITPIDVLLKLRELGVYVSTQSIVKTSVYSGGEVYKEKIEYLM